MLSGKVVVHGNAGSGAAAALRSGTVVVYGDAAARLGVSMKGGEVIVAGSCGYMAGFMAQKGTLIVCGDTGEAFADSMYATVCYVGGQIASLGTDAVVSPMDAGEIERLERRDDANYGQWRDRAHQRRYRPPEVARILDVEFVLE